MRVFWKIYCWYIVITVLLVSVTRPPEAVLGWLSKCILAISLLGLFAFSYRKLFLSSVFWKGWFFLHLAREIFEMYTHRDQAPWPVWILGIAHASPTYFALFLYAFRSDDMWNVGEGVGPQNVEDSSTTNVNKEFEATDKPAP